VRVGARQQVENDDWWRKHAVTPAVAEFHAILV
jgi:hypothetical protein